MIKTKKAKEIYLDYAAATPLDKDVSLAMQDAYKRSFASPSSIHRMGISSKNLLEKARKETAEILGVNSGEIIFTSGSTESNNLAIVGALNASKEKKPHIVTTNIEHSSVMEICKHLQEKKRAQVTYVEVEKNGVVDPEKIKKALKRNTILVSVMYANSEIGTVMPIREIAKEIRNFNKNHNKNSHKIIFHTDATQAVNYLPVQVLKLGVDMMSLSSVKFYGPKGVGALYVKKNTQLEKIIFGGDQQFDLRAGSYNLPGIIGLARALMITEQIKEKEIHRLQKLRDYFLQKLMKLSKERKMEFIINGDLEKRLPNNVNITIPNIPSDLLVIELSERGIMCAAKSACKAMDSKASYVIQAINKDIKDTDGSLRFSLGRYTEKKDIDRTIKSLQEILKKLKKWYS